MLSAWPWQLATSTNYHSKSVKQQKAGNVDLLN